ncbi:MAG TPA: hypothetical protein VFU88_22900 [Ktedonobacterales bacterium]|nr:hypothetical protein [Ktedonobacterales bacterium]
MGPRQRGSALAGGARPVSVDVDLAAPAAARHGASWERRLAAGLRLAAVPELVQAGLVQTLGTVGVEAEFLLGLIRDFPLSGAATRERGTIFLTHLDAWGRRVVAAGNALEAATQSFLAALETAFPGLRAAAASGDVWWPELPPITAPGDRVEPWLRRCGYAYRHVVAAHLASQLDALTEHLATLLQALHTLPPAGTLPLPVLYQGLDELTTTLQGYLIPQQLLKADQRAPGLLPGLARLRALDARDDTSLASDVAWAHAQYAQARAAAMAGSAGRAGVPAGVRTSSGPLREWQRVIASLEALGAFMAR